MQHDEQVSQFLCHHLSASVSLFLLCFIGFQYSPRALVSLSLPLGNTPVYNDSFLSFFVFTSTLEAFLVAEFSLPPQENTFTGTKKQKGQSSTRDMYRTKTRIHFAHYTGKIPSPLHTYSTNHAHIQHTLKHTQTKKHTLSTRCSRLPAGTVRTTVDPNPPTTLNLTPWSNHSFCF